MKTSTITTTLSRHTGEVINREVKENLEEVDQSVFYRPLVEVLFKDMKLKGLIK